MLFAFTNIAVLAMVSVIVKVFGLNELMLGYGFSYGPLAVMCLLWGGIGSFISLRMSKWIAKRSMRIQILESNGQDAALVSLVHRLAKTANLPKMPEVGVYESAEVNAFATGPSKSNSLVAMSTGLLNSMNEQELEGVLAHEVSHIANGDMVTMTIIQGVVNAFVMFLANIASTIISNFLSSDDDGLGWIAEYAIYILCQIVFGFMALPIVSFFSRTREYRADAGAARIAGKDKMIAALKKLQQQYESGGVFDKKSAKMNAFKISSKEGGLMALISTHPRLADRIKALEQDR